MTMYRIYCGGVEFGRDYTRAEAQAIKAAYKAAFPHLRYYIRKVKP